MCLISGTTTSCGSTSGSVRHLKRTAEEPLPEEAAMSEEAVETEGSMNCGRWWGKCGEAGHTNECSANMKEIEKQSFVHLILANHIENCAGTQPEIISRK